MSPPRVVIDTNVLLSSLLFHASACSWLRTTWQTGSVRPLVSRKTIDELLRVLCYPKFNLTDIEREDLLTDYLPWCETATIFNPPMVPQCRDPFDLPFLELALAAKANALVTGDDDLLTLAQTFPVPILTPLAFRKRLTFVQ